MSVVRKRRGARGFSALDAQRSDRLAVEWSRSLASARGRIGRTPIERLIWLLQFAIHTREGLSAFDASALAELGAEVWSFAEHSQMYMSRDGSKSISADELLDLVEAMGEGIRRLCGPSPDAAGWHFEPAKFGSLHRAVQAQTFRTYYFGDFRPVFLMGAAELLSREGRRIKTCAWPLCSRLFVRRKRGAYCSRACSQKARTKRHRDKRGSQWREQRHAYYVRQIEERGDMARVRHHISVCSHPACANLKKLGTGAGAKKVKMRTIGKEGSEQK
jgi:hypothetical protein